MSRDCLSRSALHRVAPASTASADFSLRVMTRRPFRREARSPQVRTRSFTAQPLHLRSLAFGHESFAVKRLLALAGFASYALRVPRLTVYVPHFLPTLGHPRAVVLPFARCGQLAGGLAPPRSRPCWAHAYEARCARRLKPSAPRRHPNRPQRTPPAALCSGVFWSRTPAVALQRRARTGHAAPRWRREAEGLWPRAQRGSLTDSSRMIERSERSERSEFGDGPRA